jgi:surface protein
MLRSRRWHSNSRHRRSRKHKGGARHNIPLRVRKTPLLLHDIEDNANHYDNTFTEASWAKNNSIWWNPPHPIPGHIESTFHSALYQNNIPSELRHIMMGYLRGKLTDRTIHFAVKLYHASFEAAYQVMVHFGAIWEWDVSEVTDMSLLFLQKKRNPDLSLWNVSKVTNMNLMFRKASLFNQPLDNWDVRNVTDMNEMFCDAVSFNQPLDNWDVRNVTKMSYMFREASAFNQPLNNWDVRNVTNMSYMFREASAFNQPLNNWDVRNVTNMNEMFFYATAFNQPLSNWDVSNVTNMSNMFHGASSFNQSLEEWNVRNGTEITGIFHNTNLLDLPSWYREKKRQKVT